MDAEQTIPVSKGTGGVLWRGHKVTIDDFPEVREYVDSCISPAKAEPKWAAALSQDYEMLKKLVQEVGRTIPTKDSLACKSVLPSIPPAPQKPLSVNKSFRFCDPIFRKTLLQVRAHSRYLVEYKNYLDLRKEWDVANKAHRSSTGNNTRHGSKSRDLPGKPVPPPPISKYGALPDSKKSEFHHYLKARDENAAQLWAWRKSMRDYKSRLPEMQSQHETYKRLLAYYKLHAPKQTFVDRLLKDIDRARNDAGLQFEKLQWRLLPGGKIDYPMVTRHLQTIRNQFPKRSFDDGRIKKVIGLKPSRAYLGSDEFDGYLVFLFEGCRYAVLECPWFGNALYLLEGDWNALSKLSKSELLSRHGSHARRIIHDENGSWFHQLRREISANSRKSTKT